MIPLSDIKQQTNVDYGADDALLETHLAAAVAQLEDDTHRIIEQREFVEEFASFTQVNHFGELSTPLVSVASVECYDAVEGDLQTLATSVYRVVTGKYGHIELKYDQEWPDILCRNDAIKITYTAGFTKDTIPANLRLALMVLTAHFYENRELLAPVQLYEVSMSYRTLISSWVKPVSL